MINEKINQILTKELEESKSLDYKVEEYSKENLADFLKDTLAFLNSEEAYGEDKFIILGVADNKYITGLKKTMRDDNEYQDLLDNITPRPEITTGTTSYEKENNDKKTIGYIYISGKSEKNRKRVYELNQEYKSNHDKYVSEGQSFIRRGSSNYVLTNEDRERIFENTIISSENVKHRAIMKIDVINKSEQTKYKDKSKEKTIQYDSENNDGEFTVGSGDSVFVLNWNVVNKDTAHIRAGNSEKIGYMNDNVEWPPNKELSNYNYSSFDRRITKKESFILVNKLGKILGVRLISADSKSHGASKNRVEFEYKCLN